MKEAKERVRSAIINAGFDFPMRRITVNLAPADLPKQGGRYDLPIAIGILAASEQIPATSIQGKEFIGELGLAGELRACQGLLPVIMACAETASTLIMPYENGLDNQLADNPRVALAKNLPSQCLFTSTSTVASILPEEDHPPAPPQQYVDLADIIGQVQAKKALEVAAAGAQLTDDRSSWYRKNHARTCHCRAMLAINC